MPAGACAPRAHDEEELQVAWHDLECGSYRADLELWHELAQEHPGPVLEIGAGTGRVAIDLARAGHAVTALERDAVLLAALRARAAGQVRPVLADARSFHLPERSFSLCLVPMQTIQLLGGPAGRSAFLRAARAHMRSGGLLACAILAAVGAFDCEAGDIGPTPERAAVGGRLLISRPLRVHVGRRGVVIERERQVLDARAPSRPGRRAGVQRDVVELNRVSARQLMREAVAAGLRPEPVREVPPTEDHVGSAVVMLRA
jgi:SAM-dependent methyltransferase